MIYIFVHEYRRRNILKKIANCMPCFDLTPQVTKENLHTFLETHELELLFGKDFKGEFKYFV